MVAKFCLIPFYAQTGAETGIKGSKLGPKDRVTFTDNFNVWWELEPRGELGVLFKLHIFY
jgi:hypothetical protein